jgi:hypothetical protein
MFGKKTLNLNSSRRGQWLMVTLTFLFILALATFGFGASKKQDISPQEQYRRQQRLEAEKQKIVRLEEGEIYTLVFLGIRSNEEKAESTLTAQSIPDFSEKFGLGNLTVENFLLLPNENGVWQALGGTADEAQVKIALDLAIIAQARRLRLQVISHSNGIQGASEFFRRMGDGFRVTTSLVIAPNSREWSDLAVVVSHSDKATLLTSNKDNRLSTPWVARRSMEMWRGNLKYGYGFSNVAYFQTFQKGHGAQHYLSEYNVGRYKQFP